MKSVVYVSAAHAACTCRCDKFAKKFVAAEDTSKLSSCLQICILRGLSAMIPLTLPSIPRHINQYWQSLHLSNHCGGFVPSAT